MNNDGDRLEGAWIYFIGPFLGSVLAVAFWLLLRPAWLKLYGKEEDLAAVADEEQALAMKDNQSRQENKTNITSSHMH
jgi:hypothetical protein